jgi:hypothetical protein
MTAPEERKVLIGLVNEATLAGVRQAHACKILGLSARTVQRWQRGEPDAVDGCCWWSKSAHRWRQELERIRQQLRGLRGPLPVDVGLESERWRAGKGALGWLTFVAHRTLDICQIS